MNSIMLIRNERSFMVNAMIQNLNENGYQVQELPFEVKQIEMMKQFAEIIVIYGDEDLEENTEEYAKTFVYLKEVCVEEGKKLILIGNKTLRHDLQQYLPHHLFTEFFERPLDMNQFIEKINVLTDTAEEEVRKKCVLVVDDDVSYLRVLKEWLKEDYQVGIAKSGMQAITWLARNNVDLILLDYDMPVTNGLKVFEMLRSEQFSKDIPVMFLTGKDDRESILRVMTLKPAGYMLKNISREQLLANLEKFFNKQL